MSTVSFQKTKLAAHVFDYENTRLAFGRIASGAGVVFRSPGDPQFLRS